MSVDYYDRQGRPMTITEWAEAFGDMESKIVAKTDVDGVTVSTVWLGLDHSFSDTGPPVIFETMIFGDSPYDEDQWRYCTEADAQAHHDQVVAALRAGTEPPDWPEEGA